MTPIAEVVITVLALCGASFVVSAIAVRDAWRTRGLLAEARGQLARALELVEIQVGHRERDLDFFNTQITELRADYESVLRDLRRIHGIEPPQLMRQIH